MADARIHQAAMNAGGGFIKWDWNKNKYVWVSKSELQKKSENKKLPTPSPYEQNVAALKKHRHHNQPSFKVPVKKAYRQPLQMSNKQIRPSSKGQKSNCEIQKKERAVKPLGRDDLLKIREKANKENQSEPSARVEANIPAPPAELLAGHGTFVSIVSNRAIHLNAALTFWKQNPGSLISYLIRTGDDSLTVDVLPILTMSLVRQTTKAKQISMGAWLDFLPTLHKLLSSKFADYIKVCLDLLRTLLRHWAKELQKQKDSRNADLLLQSQSVSGIYGSLISMTDTVNSLATRNGSVGKKAKAVKDLLDQL
ncbi:KATNB1-like protein 1 [Asterias rubens]|uniref:KATNB1-like protein 1 n=1 Tax=Asterias rubens TaxID=7604 RepID=UPI00145561E9|nr:KATNB1-like protein 1 [Asterias rubens]